VIPSFSPLRLLAVGLVAVLLLSACGAGRPPAAVVDGERITDAQVASDVKLFTFVASLSRAACGQAVQGETPESACARFTLSNLIQEDLVRQYAGANGIAVPGGDVAAAIGQLQTSLGGADKLESMLKQSGLTTEDLRALAGRILLFREVQRSLAEDEVSDAQLRQSYEANRAQYTMVHVAHILLKTRAEADRIEERVTAENFADLAKRYSTDPGSARSGGDLGTVPEPQFSTGYDPTFVQATLALRPGEISRPVHTQFGWHVIRLISLDVTPFDQVRQQLLDQASGQVFDRWLRDRLSSAEISVNPKYGRFDPATGQVVVIRSTVTGSPVPPAATPSPTP